MGDRPRFSIIMPTCRRPALLRRAMQSVVGQTFRDFELIVVDDGNDRETPGIVAAFRDERIVLLQHDRNRGPAAAYNTGIRASRGEWISFLDDDDEYLPRFLERTLDFVQKTVPPVGFVWSGIERVIDSPSGEVPGSKTTCPPCFETGEQALAAATSIGNGHGLAVRRESLEEAGLYDETYQVCEDTELLFRLAPQFRFAVIPEVLVKIHSHPCGQLTDPTNLLLRLECHERLLDRHRDLIDRYPVLRTLHFSRLIALCYRAGLKGKGRRRMLRILGVNPFRISVAADWASYELFGEDLRTRLTGTALGMLLRRWKHWIARKFPMRDYGQ